MSFYVYRALTPEQRRIRLIHLLPRAARSSLLSLPARTPSDTNDSSSEVRVRCTISHVSLDRPPPYLALSYTWGNVNHKVPILVGSTYLQVTSGLEVALAHLTPEYEPLILWIDALCIDQDDEVEKTEQVQQMQQIYANATSVITWLGPAADNSDAAMHWIQHYGALSHEFSIGTKPELRLRRLLQIYESEPDRLPHERIRSFLQDIVTQLTPVPNCNDSIELALSKFFTRAYWSRIWVVQEVVHAKRVQFVCGDVGVSEEPLNHSLRLLRNFGLYRQAKTALCPRLTNSGSTSSDTRNPINILKLRRSAGPFPLIYLIRVVRYFEATDFRDKIFALLSFAADAATLNLRPDYRKSWKEIYRETTISLLRNGFWDVLSLCEFREEPSELPSWVPDFTRIGVTPSLQQRAMKRGITPVSTVLQPKFSASEWAHDSKTPHEPMQVTSETLTVRATLVGEIDRVGTTWEPNGVRKWIQELLEFSNGNTIFSDSDRLKAIWRTSVADQEIRHGNQKLRLSEHELEKTHNLLSNLDLEDTDAPTLLSLGLGDHLYQMNDTAHNRKPFRTSNGRFGIGSCNAVPGDLLYILLGADVPYILRRGTNGRLLLVGEAYAHGIMDGELGASGPSIGLVTIF
ncbi:hypothetical protein OPT61_g621 [Boeremia exigua]|uniref:Uncharacterized protein n=1 Tax=Boeremia exigua TaxID=749465 RepID=A0ACC2ITB8_9PLEO|nr:hypothetical protein OPT61_g621 [Boeremia exigua]